MCQYYTESDAIPFQGANDCLSNFSPCTLNLNGQQYSSSEQAWQHNKAVQHQRPDLAAEIMSTEDARDIKKISRKIYTKKEWEEENVSLMRDIIEAKAMQNDCVTQALNGVM